MDIKTTKLELMQLLLQTEEISLLEKLKEVFEQEQGDWWDEMSPEEQEEVKKGLSEADSDKVISNEEVMKHFDKWH